MFWLAGLLVITTGCSAFGPAKIKIISGEFLAGQDGPRRNPPIYDREESIYFRVKVKGFKLQAGNNIWLEEGLKISDEKQQVLTWADAEGNEHRFDFPLLLDKNQKLEGLIKVVSVENKIDLPLAAPAKRYLLAVTIRDKIGGSSDTKKFLFLLKTGGTGYNEKNRFPVTGRPE